MPLFFENLHLSLFFAISLFTLLLSFIAIKFNSKSIDNVALIIAYITMSSFYGFREAGTTDIKMYLDNFDALNNFSDFNWGFSFFVLMKSIKIISSEHSFFIFASSLIFSTLLLIFVHSILKNKPYKALLMISMLYGWYMLDLATNTYRQGVSLIFIMFSMLFIAKKEYIKFSIAAVIAISIHWGALIPEIICIVSFLISKKITFIKYLSLFAILLFGISFFINLDIAKNIASNPLTSSLDSIFVGVNIASKVSNYLNSEVDGSAFYDISLLRKIKFTIEAFLPLVLNTLFLFKLSKNNDDTISKVGVFYFVTSAYIAILNIYAVSIISMAWFFRNFYWIPIASYSCLIIMLYSLKNSNKHNMFVALYIFLIILLSILTIWTSELLKMSYPL
ncbi:EpsG family protein [Klebsiella quasipneumoniae]|uniref:EpsG family protein n=1 Tax=Klebsiella pneumoniae complex TaxID=3390273 RepID=UPI001CD1CCD1|nr:MULTISPECIES: EpsG family protein [Klebsiella]MCH2027894.1 EpsG family protein [Klebsiella quasipneumoniae]MCQ3866445.1 EpsG family protein [Klebsiella quasipneumoniae]HDS8991399.1 EpsG family protein [Klebsiella pneumoniae subsp. pneumoniae]